MNAIRQTQQLNKRELENAIPPSASWHADYRDTAWVYIGGIPLDLSEGDVITVFSQFGNPTHLNLIRDRETGKSKGFGFLKYKDQRSCDLAVDNLTGADLLGRMLRVDHTRYKKRDDEDDDTWRIERLEAEAAGNADGKRASDTEESANEQKRRKRRKPMLKEEEQLEKMLAVRENGEDEDPMKDYLVAEKREEVRKAKDKEKDQERRHKHRRRRGDQYDESGRSGRNHHREDDRKGQQMRSHDTTNRRDRHESVDSDGDTVKRRSRYDDKDQEPYQRVDSRDQGRKDSRPKRDSRTEGSNPERLRTTSRSQDDRSPRRRNGSRDGKYSTQRYSSDDEEYDRGTSSRGHRSRRSAR